MKNIRIRLLLVFILILSFPVASFATGSPYTSEPVLNLPPLNPDAPRIDDREDLYSPEAESDLLEKIREIQETYQTDIVLVTVSNLSGKTIEQYTGDYYDYGGYGIGEDRNGVILLVSMSTREVQITTTGSGIRAVTDYGVNYLFDAILPHLSDGEYDRAAHVFVSETERLLKQASEGAAYDVENPVRPTLSESLWFAVMTSPVGLAISGILGFTVMRSQTALHKNAVRQNLATFYLLPNNTLWASKENHFVDERISIRRIPVATSSKSNSGSFGRGGSTTRTSSSGQRHGGGSRRF